MKSAVLQFFIIMKCRWWYKLLPKKVKQLIQVRNWNERAEVLNPCHFQKFPSHLQENLEKKTHAHTALFFFEKSWAKFFYKPFVHLILQFNSIINRGFYVCKYFLKKLVEFYLTKTNFAKIYISSWMYIP